MVIICVSANLYSYRVMMLLKKELGKNIQKLRKSQRMTQEKFADFVGIDPKNVSKIENGLNYPAAETLVAIANALNVEIYELFVFNDIPYEQMRHEIIEAINDKQKLVYLYKQLKN